MAARVYEDVWEVESASVEPVPFGDLATYPLPRLRLSGGSARLRLPVVALENGAVRAVVCPSLGCRVVALSDAFDLPERLEPEESVGPRGPGLLHGIEVWLGDAVGSMASFDHLVHEPVGEGGAAVMLFGTTPGSRVSLQVVFSLSPGSDALCVEARVFNRSLEQQPLKLTVGRGGKGFFSESDIVPEAFLAPRDSLAFPFEIVGGEACVPTTTYASAEDVYRYTDAPVESLPVHLRGAGYLRLAGEAAVGGDFRAAVGRVDSALATLGDDPLAWWQRAVLTRLLGEDDDGASLTAAHALSPLEPVLRAEAFLATPQTHGREPSAVMAPLRGDPDAMLECVHLYIEAGLFQEASRLIDECLRQREVALLRYLQAWLLLTRTRMEVEGAGEVARAAGLTVEPPFPWRPFEVLAVRELAERFPKDGRLGVLAGLVSG